MSMLQKTSRKPSKSTKALNLSIDAGLLEEARQSEINISALLTRSLRQELAKRWREDNKQAFEATRKRVEKHGLWNDGLRSWE
jgi:antitoxin CcdA